MKIKLEANEIGAILKEWAKMKYKTHNINCDLILSKNLVEAEIEVVMPEQDMAETQANVNIVELMASQAGLPRLHQEPDLMPNFAGTAEGL